MQSKKLNQPLVTVDHFTPPPTKPVTTTTITTNTCDLTLAIVFDTDSEWGAEVRLGEERLMLSHQALRDFCLAYLQQLHPRLVTREGFKVRTLDCPLPGRDYSDD